VSRTWYEKLGVWLFLTVFALFVFALGHDAGDWQYGQTDKTGVLIHAAGALAFCWALVRQIRKAKGV